MCCDIKLYFSGNKLYFGGTDSFKLKMYYKAALLMS